MFMISRALQDLKRAGLVNAPSHGYWRWTGHSQDCVNLEDGKDSPNGSSDERIDDIEDIAPIVRPEKEVGEGSECVYLYFNPNDRALAELKDRDVWECKIGLTSGCNAIPRILNQGVRTALSRLPTVGLVLRTHDSLALETALHSALRLVGAEVPDAPGDEWFITSPARVEAWYGNFKSALSTIDTSSTAPLANA